MTEKVCSKCNITKIAHLDFYKCTGSLRAECKACTILLNMRYQKKVKSWNTRYEDNETRRIYMRDYYSKNKEKFAKYREEFRVKYPKYHTDYYHTQKQKKSG